MAHVDLPILKTKRENHDMKKLKHTRYLLAALITALAIPTAMAQGETNMQAPTSLSETYDAWTVQCANQQQGEKTQRTCQMSQELLQQKTRQRVLTFAIGMADKKAKVTLVLPFGLLLSEGVRVQIGEEEILRGAYRTCLPAGCVAEIELPAETIKKLESAETASVLMTANSGQPVKTDVSLKGFSSAFQRLTELSAVPAK
ncbi:invasion associated locus B family protein [Mesorhizobium sp. A623]